MSDKAKEVEKSTMPDTTKTAIESLKKAHAKEIAELKEKHKNEMTEKHWAYVEKEEGAIRKILALEFLDAAQKQRILVLRYRVSQLSASAEYQVKSADERIQIAQMEGVNARLQVMGLEAEMEEKDNEIALLKEYFGTD